MERVAPNNMDGPFASDYFNKLKTLIDNITSQGSYAVLGPQNFGRYYGNIITDTIAFQNFFKHLAEQFKDNTRVIFDTNNEYHDMDQKLVFDLNQTAINGVRSAGATSQYIWVEGN